MISDALRIRCFRTSSMPLCREVLGGIGLMPQAECLASHSIVECAHVMECTLLDLLQLGNLTQTQAEQAQLACARAVAPRASTMQHILDIQKAYKILPTGIAPIDDAMGGGLLGGAVTEVVGAANIGKSQFCATMVARAVSPAWMNAAVVYIDTEMKISERRIQQILQSQLAQTSASGSVTAADALLKRVHIVRPGTGGTLLQVLQRLPDELATRSVGLIILDSIAALARLEFSPSQGIERQQLLAKQAGHLKRCAEQFGIPVLVTNQVTGGAGGNGQRAALGAVWAHAVSCRLVLEQVNGGRVVRVAKSPTCGHVAAAFTITDGGIEPLAGSAVETGHASSMLAANIAAEHLARPAGAG